jgi:hypothetical protein
MDRPLVSYQLRYPVSERAGEAVSAWLSSVSCCESKLIHIFLLAEEGRLFVLSRLGKSLDFEQLRQPESHTPGATPGNLLPVRI